MPGPCAPRGWRCRGPCPAVTDLESRQPRRRWLVRGAIRCSRVVSEGGMLCARITSPQPECRRQSDVYPLDSATQVGMGQDTCEYSPSRSRGTKGAPESAYGRGYAQHPSGSSKPRTLTHLDQMCAIHASTGTGRYDETAPSCLNYHGVGSVHRRGSLGAESIFRLTKELLHEVNAILRDPRTRRELQRLFPVQDLLPRDVALDIAQV
jgi:hypothetical protein